MVHLPSFRRMWRRVFGTKVATLSPAQLTIWSRALWNDANRTSWVKRVADAMEKSKRE